MGLKRSRLHVLTCRHCTNYWLLVRAGLCAEVAQIAAPECAARSVNRLPDADRFPYSSLRLVQVDLLLDPPHSFARIGQLARRKPERAPFDESFRLSHQ